MGWVSRPGISDPTLLGHSLSPPQHFASALLVLPEFFRLSCSAGLGPVALKVVALLPLQAGSCLLLVLSSGWQEHLYFFLPACCFQVQ